MSFTGKATYDGTRTEIAKRMKDRSLGDLTDLVGIISPYETPLLDAIGDPLRSATSKQHEWTESNRRYGNGTHEFKAIAEVTSEGIMSSQFSLVDEMDYQKQERLRELMRDLENAVINGKGNLAGVLQIVKSIEAKAALTEELVNKVLRQYWEDSAGSIDLIVVNGYQKRQLNKFTCNASFYESNFGICKIVTCHWVPKDAVIFLDSSYINVLPLKGCSFRFRPLASNDEYESGEISGEYTLELKNPECHAALRGLAVE